MLLFVLAQTIDAQPADTTLLKSENTAVNRSMMATLIPCAVAIPLIANDSPESDWNEIAAVSLLSTGIIFGPGFGHLYAENKKAFTHGVFTRLAGAGMFIGGISSFELFSKDKNNSELLILGGGIFLLYGVLHDISSVDNSVRKYNQDKNLAQLYIYPSFGYETNEVKMNFTVRF